MLYTVPYEQVIGYDTDCIFLGCKPNEVSDKILRRFGDEPGQLHFDGIYTNVRHLSPKQYYGLEDGKPFGKFSAVPNGDHVAEVLIEYGDDLICAPVEQFIYIWNPETQDYEGEYIPAKISLDNFEGGISHVSIKEI